MSAVDETIAQVEAIRQQRRAAITEAVHILEGPHWHGWQRQGTERRIAREHAYWLMLRSVHRQLVISGHNVKFTDLARERPAL